MIEGVHHAYAFGSESSRHGADRIRKLRHLFRFVSAKEDGDDGFHRRRVDYDSWSNGVHQLIDPTGIYIFFSTYTIYISDHLLHDASLRPGPSAKLQKYAADSSINPMQ